MKGSIPGFLLIEATIAILISIMLSAVLVFYQGNAATLRAQTVSRSRLLMQALTTLEGMLAGDRVIDGEINYVPCSRPIIEGLLVEIPDLCPCMQVCVSDGDAKLIVTSWENRRS